jgi:hypothetical protein
MKIFRNMQAFGVKTAKVIGACAASTDALGRVVKVLIPGVEFTSKALRSVSGTAGVRSGLGLLRDQLKGTDAVIKATNIAERGKEWVDDGSRKGILKSTPKTISRISLTVSSVLDTVLFVDKVSTGFFSRAALSIGGKLPFLEVVKNGFVMIASIFGICHASRELKGAQKKIDIGSQRKIKWERRKAALGDENQLREEFQSKLTAREAANASSEDDCNQKKIDHLNKYITAVNNGKTEQLLDHKISKYSARLDNGKIVRKKSWLSIAADISKLAMITLGMLSVALSGVFPWLTLPKAALILSGLGFISYSISLGKCLFDNKDVGPKLPIEPNEPAFA